MEYDYVMKTELVSVKKTFQWTIKNVSELTKNFESPSFKPINGVHWSFYVFVDKNFVRFKIRNLSKSEDMSLFYSKIKGTFDFKTSEGKSQFKETFEAPEVPRTVIDDFLRVYPQDFFGKVASNDMWVIDISMDISLPISSSN